MTPEEETITLPSGYTMVRLDTIQKWRKKVAKARSEALEEAARLCEDHGHSNGAIRASHKHLAAAIRALKEKE